MVTIGAVGGRESNEEVAADAQLLAHQRLWVSPDVDVTIRLADVVERAGGSLTRVLSADIFAIVVSEITVDSQEMAFALEHDLAIVTESEAVEQIESQLRGSTVVAPTHDSAPTHDLAPTHDDSAVGDIDLDAEHRDVTPPAQAEVLQQATHGPSVTIDEVLDLEEASRGATVVPNAVIATGPPAPNLEADLDELLAKQASLGGAPVDDLVSDDLVIVAPRSVVEADDGQIPAGWYPVSGSSDDERYHDGADWTDQFRSGGDGDPLATPFAAFADEKNRWLAAIPAPALAVIIGSVGPWAVLKTSVGNVSVAGVDMSGSVAVLLVMASAGALAFGALRGNRPARISGIAGFVLVALLGLYELANLDSQVTDSGFASASAGWGLWLALLGSIAGVAVGLRLARFDSNQDD